MKKNTLSAETVKIVRHIFQARIDHARTPSVALAYKAALDIFNYALNNNLECLYQWDYLLTKEDVKKSQETS